MRAAGFSPTGTLTNGSLAVKSKEGTGGQPRAGPETAGSYGWRGDKAELVGRIKVRGYQDVLFVGDANRDLEYARRAGVTFVRMRCAEDFRSLAVLVQRGFPNQAEPWAWTEAQKERFRSSTCGLVDALIAGQPLAPAEAADMIHAG